MKVKIITPICIACGNGGFVSIEATDAQLDAYNNGELIQVVFPEIPKEVREQMITGTHPKCWDRMWS